MTKLDDQSIRCILLGISEESKAHRLYDPISQMIIISRDVIFEDDKSWDSDKGHKEVIFDDLNWGSDDDEPDAVPGNENEAESDEHSSIQESEIDGSNGSNEENLSSTCEYSSLESHEQRSRRKQSWVTDYENGEAYKKKKT